MTKTLVAENIRYKGFCYVLEENEVKIIRILYGGRNFMQIFFWRTKGMTF